MKLKHEDNSFLPSQQPYVTECDTVLVILPPVMVGVFYLSSLYSSTPSNRLLEMSSMTGMAQGHRESGRLSKSRAHEG